MPDATLTTSVRPPWFRRRPRATILAAGLLFGGVLTLRLLVHGSNEAISLLFSLPIALVAITFGLAGGFLAGLLGVGGVLTWVIVDSVSLSPLGWSTRVVPLLLLGVLLGDASDRLETAEQERHDLAVAAQRQREAAELNDTIVQGLAAAKWSLEAGQHDRGLQIVSDTLETAQAHVSRLLRAADAGGDGRTRRVLFDWRRAQPVPPADQDSAAPAATPSVHDEPAATSGRNRIT
jgi:glucose-6-phosphate-specific signal transduction histidine kinase